MTVADGYLEERAGKGFTVIQAVIFWGGVSGENRYGEPGYEDHPSRFDPKCGWSSARDVRRFAYRAVVDGAAR